MHEDTKTKTEMFIQEFRKLTSPIDEMYFVRYDDQFVKNTHGTQSSKRYEEENIFKNSDLDELDKIGTTSNKNS